MTTTTTTPQMTDADLTTKIDALTADRERLTTAGKPSAKSAKAGGIPLSPARGDPPCQTLSFARASTANTGRRPGRDAMLRRRCLPGGCVLITLPERRAFTTSDGHRGTDWQWPRPTRRPARHVPTSRDTGKGAA